jgi:hypothetical protein
VTTTLRPSLPEPAAPAEPQSRARASTALTIAAITSLGAGAIHATAAGAHSEYRAAVIAFVLTAVAQVGWGGWALHRPGRLVCLLGAAVNVAAFFGWLLAKTGGIDFIAGLDTKEPVQFPDGLAATLAVIAVVGALASLASRPTSTKDHGVISAAVAVATVAFVIPGMVSAASHEHTHDHAAALPPPVPYLATLPVDLSGVPGVSDEEVAEAEDLVTESLGTLPRFADIPTILAMGYRTIGDSDTGYEHFVNWPLLADGRVLDPEYPESLVFQVDPATGEKTLSAAMFFANPGDTLDTVPDLGGALIQWHIHNDLCYRGEPDAWRVAGVTEPGEECRPGAFRLSQSSVPMVHVWIVPTPCGPFAALEGDGAGQIRPGEQRLCDHAHGAPR